ncbi:hypothetical protein SDJN03_28408, partial [Cucurbita argyrosperma subsp. sororia]
MPDTGTPPPRNMVTMYVEELQNLLQTTMTSQFANTTSTMFVLAGHGGLQQVLQLLNKHHHHACRVVGSLCLALGHGFPLSQVSLAREHLWRVPTYLLYDTC